MNTKYVIENTRKLYAITGATAALLLSSLAYSQTGADLQQTTFITSENTYIAPCVLVEGAPSINGFWALEFIGNGQNQFTLRNALDNIIPPDTCIVDRLQVELGANGAITSAVFESHSSIVSGNPDVLFDAILTLNAANLPGLVFDLTQSSIRNLAQNTTALNANGLGDLSSTINQSYRLGMVPTGVDISLPLSNDPEFDLTEIIIRNAAGQEVLRGRPGSAARIPIEAAVGEQRYRFFAVDSFGAVSAAAPGSLLVTVSAPSVITQSKLFTSTNNPSGNEIVAFDIMAGGRVQQAETYSTGGMGDADDGDFDGQGSVRIIGDYLLVVNAGEDMAAEHGSVSVFRIDTRGLLTQVDQNPASEATMNIDSGGIRPVSIDYVDIRNQTFVAVANQHSNPLCFTPNPTNNTLATCVDQYGQLLNSATNTRFTNSTDRNVTLFSFQDGILTPQNSGNIVYESPNYGGPSQISFNPDGSTAAVTTWGVPHFTSQANTNLQMPSRTYLYDVSVSNGNLSLDNSRFFQKTGVSGSIGFSYSSRGDYIYVANFNIATTVRDHSVTALATANISTVFNSDPLGRSVASGNVAVPGVGVEACWSWITADDSQLIIPSFTANSVTTVGVDGGNLTHQATLVRRGADIPDTKDVFVTSDGQYAYVLGALESHTVSVYDYDAVNGVLSEKNDSPYEIPFSRATGSNVNAMTHAYLGLAGWPAGYVGH